MENHIEKVHSLLTKFDTAMLVTQGLDRVQHARPMGIAKAEHNGDVWFFTGRSGRVLHEIAEDPVVLLVFQDERSAYLSMRGNARLVQDRARVKEFWKEAYKTWFPGGIDDPDLALIAVGPVSAEYWDNRGMNKLEYAFEAAKAYVRGEKPDVSDADQHAKVAM